MKITRKEKNKLGKMVLHGTDGSDVKAWKEGRVTPDSFAHEYPNIPYSSISNGYIQNQKMRKKREKQILLAGVRYG